MERKIEKLPKSLIKIFIRLSPEEMEIYRRKLYDELNQEANISGFRPGKVPIFILEEKVGKDVIKARLVEKALKESYRAAVYEEHLSVLAQPNIVFKSEEPLEYEATVAVFPEVVLKDLDGVKISKKEVVVEDKDFEQSLSSLRKEFAQPHDVDRAAELGDRVEIDFEAFDGNGKFLSQTSSKNHPVLLGEGLLYNDFEKEIVGMKAGSEKKFFINFPKDYRYKPFRNQKIQFRVFLHKVQEMILPEIDDAFIEKITEKKQERSAFDADLRGHILESKTLEERRRRENEFLEKLVDCASVDLPDVLIDEEIDFLFSHLKIKDTDHEEVRKKLRPQAERNVILRVVLQHLFQTHQFKLNNEEEHRLESAQDESEKNRMKHALLLNKLFAYYLKS